MPVANTYGYLDSSWLKDFNGYKIENLGVIENSIMAVIDDREKVQVLTLGSRGLSITLSSDYVNEDLPYLRAIVYRFLIYNPENYDLEWDATDPNATFIWNTYSETPPTLDENGTYIEFISTDNGLTWYGNTAARTAYDIVNNYYTKVESDDRFVNVTGDTVTGNIYNKAGNDPSCYNVPEDINDTPTYENGETIYTQYSGSMAHNDIWRIGAGYYTTETNSTGNDNGFIEIATGDNGTEELYMSQYIGGRFNTLYRRVTILDKYGNTSFPGNLTLGGPDVVGGRNDVILTVNGDTDINGAVTINNTQDAEYEGNSKPALTIGDPYGFHLQIDGDEIIAKSDPSTPAPLYLNDGEAGDTVFIGAGGINTTGDIYAKSVTTSEISTAITPDTNDNSNKIATTEFVNNYKAEYIDHWLVPDMNVSTVGKYLTNDGESSYWATFNRDVYVTYLEENSDYVIVPSDRLANAMITDVYRDGVLLTETDDYIIDHSTGRITFTETYNAEEKIIVMLETSLRIHSHAYLDSVFLVNSTAETPITADNSNRIATTAYVHSLISGITPAETIDFTSVELTGTPTAPTADPGTNTTQIATTEFVTTAITNANHAPINSPHFTGIPTAPTPSTNTNTDQLATTAYVKNNIISIVDGATLNTLKKLSQAIGNDESYSTTVTAALNTKINRGLSEEGLGNAVTGITESNGDITVIKGSTFSLSNHNHDSEYTALTPGIGSDITPIYTDNSGRLTASTATVGSDSVPVYLNHGTLTTASTTIGALNNPIYMSNGELTPISSTIGSSINPVYLSNGVITATEHNFDEYLLLTGGTVTGTLTLTDNNLPLVIGSNSDQHLEITNNGITSKSNNDTPSDLYLNENGGEVHFGNSTDGEVTIGNGTITANTIIGNISGSVERSSMDALGNVINETYAPINSPSFTGIPTAPTAEAGDNSTQIATTEYVDGAVNTVVSELISSAPDALNTLNELAAALNNDANFATTVTNSLADKLDIDSSNYIKNLSVSGTTLTITRGNDEVSILTTQDTTYGDATTSESGLMSSSDKDKLDNIETNAHNYILPEATTSSLGGVIVGNGLSVSNGIISVDVPLPTQENNSGKFLTTNGSSVSWATVDALPSQANNAGKFLTTDGTTLSWSNILDSDTHYTADLVVGSTNSAISNASSTTNSSTFINTVENGTKSGSIQIQGSGATAVTSSNGVITISSTDNNTHYTTDLVVGASNNATTNAASTTNTTTYINTVENSSKSGSIQIKGSGITNITSANGVITVNSDNSTIASSPATSDNSLKVASTEYVNNRLGIGLEKSYTLTSAATINIDPLNGSIFYLNLTRNASITISTISGYYTNNGSVISLFMPSHNYTVAWDSKIIWASGSAPDLSNNFNIITLATANNGSTWYGTALEIES